MNDGGGGGSTKRYESGRDAFSGGVQHGGGDDTLCGAQALGGEVNGGGGGGNTVDGGGDTVGSNAMGGDLAFFSRRHIWQPPHLHDLQCVELNRGSHQSSHESQLPCFAFAVEMLVWVDAWCWCPPSAVLEDFFELKVPTLAAVTAQKEHWAQRQRRQCVLLLLAEQKASHEVTEVSCAIPELQEAACCSAPLPRDESCLDTCPDACP